MIRVINYAILICASFVTRNCAHAQIAPMPHLQIDSPGPLAFSKDGTILVAGQIGRVLKRWNSGLGTPLSNLTYERQVDRWEFSGNRVAVLLRDKRIIVRDFTTGSDVFQITYDTDWIGLAKEGNLLVISTPEGFHLYDLASKAIHKLPAKHNLDYYLSENGRYLVVSGNGPAISYDLSTGTPVSTPPFAKSLNSRRPNNNDQLSFRFAEDVNHWAIWNIKSPNPDLSGSLHVINRQGKLIYSLRDRNVSSACFSKDSRFMLIGGNDGWVSLVDIKRRKVVFTNTDYAGGSSYPPSGLAFSPDGKTFAVAFFHSGPILVYSLPRQ